MHCEVRALRIEEWRDLTEKHQARLQKKGLLYLAAKP